VKKKFIFAATIKTNTMNITTRSDVAQSLQWGNYGFITDLETDDFSLPKDAIFTIRNQGSEIYLDIITPKGDLVKNVLFRGFEPILVKKILKNASIGSYSLMWGN